MGVRLNLWVGATYRLTAPSPRQSAKRKEALLCQSPRVWGKPLHYGDPPTASPGVACSRGARRRSIRDALRHWAHA
eukprot:2363744-Amphidinium_carterae.1